MFDEKKMEYDSEIKKEIPVIWMPKYYSGRGAAIKLLEEKVYMSESDFWILKNKTKAKDKMLYSGLIISHNGCLKLNDNAAAEKRFRPECVTIDKQGYGGSLVYTYCCPDQGIYEVGEASAKNCKNDYPYAMAFKRCFDRVVLKLCGLAFYGVYSDSEADEFKEPTERSAEHTGDKPIEQMSEEDFNEVVNNGKANPLICAHCHKEIKAHEKWSAEKVAELTEKEFGETICYECGKKARARIEAAKKNASTVR